MESLIRYNVRMTVAKTRCFFSRNKVVRSNIAQKRNSSLKQRDIDMLPFPGAIAYPQSCQNSYAGIHTRGDISHWRADTLGGTIDRSSQRHRAQSVHSR